jgi:hypothetical protein
MVPRFEVGEEVKVPQKFLRGAWATYGKILGKKIHPLPICRVEIQTSTGLKLHVDVPEGELRAI